MKKGALFLIIVFVISISCAQEINFNYPDEIAVNEEFTIGLELINFSSDVYDVKIDILENGNRVAQILNNDQWKSTFYYVLDAIEPGNLEEFTLKMVEDFSVGQITIKIRDSSGNAELFTGYEISKSSSSNPDPEPDPEPEQNQTDEESEESEEPEQEIIINEEVPKVNTSVLKEKTVISQIDLNSKDIKTPENKELDKGNYPTYYLITFCMLLLLLYLLKQRKPKNEFR